MNKKYKLFYPECIFSLDQISTSTFLYFPDNLATTLHPTVSIFTTGCDPYKFYELMIGGDYEFKNQFIPIFRLYEKSSKMIYDTSEILKPLYEKKFLSSIMLSYSRTEDAFKKSEEIIKKTGLSIDEIYKYIDVTMATQELISHILFEKFLEYYIDKINRVSIDKNANYEESRAQNIDYKLLLDYCEELFGKFSTKELLVKAYLLRLQQLDYFNDILISNNNLIPILKKLNPAKQLATPKYYDNLDVISWEIFRQLTDKYLSEKLPAEQISRIVQLRESSEDEITTLKNKCLKLGEQFKAESDLESLEKNITKHIKIHTEKELSDLLKLDKRIFENLIDSLFSDYKSWLGVTSFISSIIYDNAILSAGAGLATIASIGSKTYKEIADNEKKINDSEYALIYRLRG